MQWDLNPEGIGVQPMVCSVDLNFKFIGGSSLGGPISQLQNAVGFNFLANTGLYNPRTIFKSVKNYVATRPDSASGLITELSNEVSTPNREDSSYGYGAYLVPGQAINNGDFVDENSVITPPPDPNENKNIQQQVDEEITIKETEMSQEEKDTIEDQFQKEADERAGRKRARRDQGRGGEQDYRLQVGTREPGRRPYPEYRAGTLRGTADARRLDVPADQLTST